MQLLKTIFEKVLSWAIKNPIASKLIESSEWLHKKINCLVINAIVHKARTRPHPWSTMHSYTSWDALTDKTWSARHLPERACKPDCKQEEGCLRNGSKKATGCKRDWATEKELADLFKSRDKQKLSELSTCLFPAFAQHLTDGFIQTLIPEPGGEDRDRLKNKSNHNIDLSPLYGRTPEQTRALRKLSSESGERGKLKYQWIGEEGAQKEMYAPFLFDDDGKEIKAEFEKLDKPAGLKLIANNPAKKKTLFAFGGDRANAATQVAMINTLFLREHNRLAEALETEHEDWDDERVFQTARNAVIVLYIKIVVEEYINHISSSRMRFLADPAVAWRAKWNRPNWITTEFSLLYRWHSLVPDTVKWGEIPYSGTAAFLNNQPLMDNGLLESFKDLTRQPSARLGVLNTARALLIHEENAIRQGRLAKLDTYNAYRKYVQLDPKDFDDISTDPDVVKFLQDHHECVDDVEFYVGLFAEDRVKNSPLPELMSRMVAIDAFSQALTNPLLSKPVFEQKQKVFGQAGWDAIQNTSSMADVLARNYSGVPKESIEASVSLDYRPEPK